jgi:hypothetical protein
MPLSPRRSVVPFILLVGLLALSAAPAAASARGRSHLGPADVRVSRDVRLGQFSEAVVSVWTFCRSPLVVQELVVEVTQAGAAGSSAGDFGIVCDGRWHLVRVSVTTPGGGPFSPGPTKVRALLTVVDPETGDPVDRAHDAIFTFVRAQAEVHIGRNVRLGQGNAILVPIFARCDEPWVVSDLVVEVTQAAGTRAGTAAGDFGIVCDERWHRVEVQVFSSVDRFLPELTAVTASFSVLDPIDFDPVETAVDSITVFVRAPASVELFHRGRVLDDGSTVVFAKVRCLRPWVVQELTVEILQGGVAGSTSGEFGIECDERWRFLRLPIAPAGGVFAPGDAEAHAFFTVLDPLSFDPVFQGQDHEVIELVQSAPSPVTLVDQTGSQSGAIISSDTVNDTNDSQGADDFAVPAGETWSIQSVFVVGLGGVTPDLPPGVNVFVYDDGGSTPGALVASRLGVPPGAGSSCESTGPCDLTIAVSPAVTLPPGDYWISVQADMSSFPEGASWLWGFRNVIAGDPGVWRQPLGGTPDWSTTFGRDFQFRLEGTSVAAP